MKLKLCKTNRGFACADFHDFNGRECSIQDSSLATEACLWLGVDGGPQPARMHLSQPMVQVLVPLLKRFVRTGSIAKDPFSPKKRNWRWHLWPEESPSEGDLCVVARPQDGTWIVWRYEVSEKWAKGVDAGYWQSPVDATWCSCLEGDLWMRIPDLPVVQTEGSDG